DVALARRNSAGQRHLQHAGVSDLDLRDVLRGRDPLLDESVPVVAVRALPEELGAAVAAAHADVWIELEDRVLRQLGVAVDERGRMVKLAERSPDCLVNAESVRIRNERGKQQIERVARLAAGREVARQREPRTPVLRVVLDQAAAETREALG